MRSNKEAAERLKELLQQHKNGDQSAYERITDLIWIVNNSPELIVELSELYSAQAETGQDADSKPVDNTELLAKIEELEKKLKEASENSVTEEAEMLEEDIETNERLQQLVQVLEADLINTNNKYLELSDEYQEISSSLTESNKKLEKKEWEIEKIKEEKTELNNKISDLKDKLSESEKEIESLRKAKEPDEQVSEYMEHWQDAEDKLARAKEENNGLINKNRSLSAALENMKSENAKTGMIVPGEEKELYSGEYYEIIIDILKNSLKNLPEGRRKDVVKSVLDANPGQDMPSMKAEQLKKIFRTHSALDRIMEQELAECGITVNVEDRGKHIKAVYGNDPRYMYTLSTSPSNSRNGLNAATSMSKMFY